MFRSGLTFFLALLLIVSSWLGKPMPAAAQTSWLASPAALPLGPLGETTLFSFSGKRPTDLGVKDGKLTICPGSPNCVNSQTPSTDPEHSIAPLAYTSDPTTALANLKSVIATLPRTKVISETEGYLYAEFATQLMGFVDDVEFYLDPAGKVIHVRSASRLGKSDLGVNRKRVEEIREKFTALENKA